jgi:hypothetical protein
VAITDAFVVVEKIAAAVEDHLAAVHLDRLGVVGGVAMHPVADALSIRARAKPCCTAMPLSLVFWKPKLLFVHPERMLSFGPHVDFSCLAQFEHSAFRCLWQHMTLA